MKLLNPFFYKFLYKLFCKFCFIYTLKSLNLYQLTTIIKKIKKVYNKNGCERYQNLSKKGKEKKQQYGRERYKILAEDEKKAC